MLLCDREFKLGHHIWSHIYLQALCNIILFVQYEVLHLKKECNIVSFQIPWMLEQHGRRELDMAYFWLQPCIYSQLVLPDATMVFKISFALISRKPFSGIKFCLSVLEVQRPGLEILGLQLASRPIFRGLSLVHSGLETFAKANVRLAFKWYLIIYQSSDAKMIFCYKNPFPIAN